MYVQITLRVADIQIRVYTLFDTHIRDSGSYSYLGLNVQTQPSQALRGRLIQQFFPLTKFHLLR